MQSRGYKFVEHDCPANLQLDSLPKPDPGFYGALSKLQRDNLSYDARRKMQEIERMQRGEPACYSPMSWLGKISLQFDKLLGWGSETSN
jgi:hypothetical protein